MSDVSKEQRLFNIKFLGGEHAFSQEQLSEAVRAAAGRVVESHGDPGTPVVSEAEKDALRDLLDALGLVRADDPRRQMGGRTLGDNAPPRG